MLTGLWAVSNGDDGSAAGRELEMARLLQFIKHKHIDNIVWLTADVHYAAAHYYTPEQAAGTDFSPVWEFVSGPLNAGSFGLNGTDGTFGPQAVFSKVPEPGQANLSPYAGLQFFGEVNIDRRSQAMPVELKHITAIRYSRKPCPRRLKPGKGAQGAATKPFLPGLPVRPDCEPA